MYNYRIGDDACICVKGKVIGVYDDCIIVDTECSCLPDSFSPDTGDSLEQGENVFITFGKESPFNDPQTLTIVYMQGIEEGKSIANKGNNNGC